MGLSNLEFEVRDISELDNPNFDSVDVKSLPHDAINYCYIARKGA